MVTGVARPAEVAIGIVFKRQPRRLGVPAPGHRLRDLALPAVTLDRAVTQLRELGFRITGRSPSTLSLRGKPDLFEKTFGTQLAFRRQPADGLNPSRVVAEVAPGLATVIPPALREAIAVVAIQSPPRYLATYPAPVVMAKAPTVSGYYLDVLKGLRKQLSVTAVHAKGCTGRGIRVAMIDSGFAHSHAFFVANQFRSKVVLADPGSTSSDKTDPIGHGTGESANLFSVAPGIKFTGIKLTSDISPDDDASLAEGFQAALALRPLPHIISCSLEIDPPFVGLENAILDCIDAGIVVVASAGNGTKAFPGQMPEVISAGGVFVNKNNKASACNRASAYASPLYANRNVPDCCGLVGDKAHKGYIMLPVPPGSPMDVRCAKYDRTTAKDGWARFSGTSAAAPQIAGVCALMLSKTKSINAATLKTLLMGSCVDVVKGKSHPATGGLAAGPGPDAATGAGLVDALAAWQAA